MWCIESDLITADMLSDILQFASNCTIKRKLTETRIYKNEKQQHTPERNNGYNPLLVAFLTFLVPHQCQMSSAVDALLCVAKWWSVKSSQTMIYFLGHKNQWLAQYMCDGWKHAWTLEALSSWLLYIYRKTAFQKEKGDLTCFSCWKVCCGFAVIVIR